MNKTGVFATKEETEELQKLAKEAAATPVMGLSSAHMMRGGFAGDARKILMDKCYAIAKKHGLPDIEGYYGLDEKGEFVTC